MSEPVVFRNFGTKAALFTAVVDRAADRGGCCPWWPRRSSAAATAADPDAVEARLAESTLSFLLDR